MFQRLLLSLLLAIALAALSCTRPVLADDAEGTDALPVERVIMFSSGVAFFEHRGEVAGNTSIELRFDTEDINDLLKSMVLQDAGGGKISTISYSSKDPITRTLQTFAIDLTENPSLADLLSQIRGEKVELQAPDLITGTIVGVETRPRPVDDDEIVEVPHLIVLTDEGLRSVALESVGRIRLLNPALAEELRQALQVLATGHATDKKTVTINFTGEGTRPVRVGYVQESPIWKTSYRLVIREEDEPLLQGWAIVENTTETDWDDVELSLISGRPISFIMDLYEPLYVDRPVVRPELFSSLRPRTYDQDLADDQSSAVEGKLSQMRRGLLRGGKLAEPAAPAAAGGGYGGDITVGADLGYGAAVPEAEALHAYFDPTSGVSSAAQAGDIGELFKYTIEIPVSVARGQSAMLPIVNETIEGEKLSIYNRSVHAKHPLNGFRLNNTTDLHLMQGPITVFDDGAYAGDAQIQDTAPGSERLISYAVDLDVEVAPNAKTEPEQIVSARLAKGILYATHKYMRVHDYVVKNSGDQSVTLLVEHPIETGWELVEPAEPAEKTRDQYRFKVEVAAGKTQTLKIPEDRVVTQTVELTNIQDPQVRIFLAAKSISDEVKQALQEIVRRQQEIMEASRERQQYQQQIDEITREQDRIRNNMGQLPRDSELYRRYVAKFSDQEDEIEQLRVQAQEAQQKMEELRQSLDNYILSLEIG